jgi:hypothetical protein
VISPLSPRAETGMNRGSLHPAGEGTITSMLRKGWIERQLGPGGAPQFRITEAGKAAIAAKIPSSPFAR